jgi:hypothetical protein
MGAHRDRGARTGAGAAVALAAAAAVAAAAAAALALAACADFPNPSTVTDLRVLAVRVEPAEIILDPAAPGAVPDITLTPLVVDPRGGGRPLRLSIDVCPNDPAAATPPGNADDPTGYPSGGPHTSVGSARCDRHPDRVAVAAGVDPGVTPAVVARLDPAWVTAAFARDVFIGTDGKPHGGFDLGMPVVFQITVSAQNGDGGGGASSDPADTVVAIKRVVLWAAPVRADQRPNVLPVISSVRAYDRRDDATAEPLPDAVVPLDEGTPLPVPANGLWIDPALGEAERYVTAVLERSSGQAVPYEVARETLRYDFFATAGSFGALETSSEPPPGVAAPPRPHLESKYRPPPPKERPADVTIWIVVRDDRGGVSWVTRTLFVPAAEGGL